MKKKVSKEKVSKYKSTVPAVDQALRLMNCLAGSAPQQMTLTEICARLEIPKSKGYTILNTLMAHNFIEKNQQAKTYKLGLGITFLARNIIDNLDIRDIAKQCLRDLAVKTDVTAHLGQISGSSFFIVSREESSDHYGYSMRVGSHLDITHGCHGKAILAFLPENEREDILSRDDSSFYGDKNPVDPDRLREELKECRRTGYAIDLGETNPNIIAISSPVFSADSIIIGGVVLTGAFRRSKIKSFGPLVVETAKQISQKLGYRAV